MSNGLKIGLAFVGGLIAGAFAMKKYMERKSEPEFEELAAPVDEDKDDEDDEPKEEPKNEVKPVYVTQPPLEVYKKVLKEYDVEHDCEYDYDDGIDDPTPDEVTLCEYTPRNSPIMGEVPYNISPDEFMEIDSYDTDDYTLYADGYVTDSTGTPVSPEDVLAALGEDFESFFGTYDDDEIWVRNDRLRMDFSVARCADKYEDVCPIRFRRLVFG